MLTLMQRVRINEKKKKLKITTKQLAEVLGVKYGTLAMVLAGNYNSKELETKLLEWFKNN